MTRLLRVRRHALPIESGRSLLARESSRLIASLSRAGCTASHAAPPPIASNIPVDATPIGPTRFLPTLAMVDGAALARARRAASSRPRRTSPLLAGDRIRTARGRVEVLFADGSVLDLDENTVSICCPTRSCVCERAIRLTIARGATSSTIAWTPQARRPGFDSPASIGSPWTARSTEPEVAVTVLRVAGGADRATAARSCAPAPKRERRRARSPRSPYARRRPRGTRSIAGSMRSTTSASARVSARYLPAELRYYSGAFDRDGSWEYEPATATSGTRGRHRLAAVLRRPLVVCRVVRLDLGRRRPLDLADAPLRPLGLLDDRWYWIPGRRWGPAWVSWVSAPGYVGWCPLGFDNRPLYAVTNINTTAVIDATGGPSFRPTTSVRAVAVNRVGRLAADVVRGIGSRARELLQSDRQSRRARRAARRHRRRADVTPRRGWRRHGRPPSHRDRAVEWRQRR